MLFSSNVSLPNDWPSCFTLYRWRSLMFYTCSLHDSEPNSIRCFLARLSFSPNYLHSDCSIKAHIGELRKAVVWQMVSALCDLVMKVLVSWTTSPPLNKSQLTLRFSFTGFLLYSEPVKFHWVDSMKKILMNDSNRPFFSLFIFHRVNFLIRTE